MEACKIEDKGTRLYIDGLVYWGNKKSLEGWDPKIGNFYALSTRSNFKRYIACKPFSLDLVEKHFSAVAQLANKYNLKPTLPISTHGKFYTREKYVNIFFLGLNMGFQEDLDTIQRVLNKTSLKDVDVMPGEAFLIGEVH